MGTAKGDATHAAHSAEEPAVEASMARDVINIPDNVLLNGIKDYDQRDQDDLLWLINWGQQELGSRKELCDKLQCNWSTVFKICTNTYEASIASFMLKVRDLRKKAASAPRQEFIETIVTRKIFETLDYALAGDLQGGRMVMIVGHTRRGKTWAAQEWARRKQSRAVYVDCAEAGGLKAMQTEVAQGCRIGTKKKSMERVRRLIYDSFDARRILVLDEILRVLPWRGARSGPVALEFIRRLHDRRRCGMALMVTPAFVEELNTGALQDYLEQLVGRIEEPLVIPDRVLRQECQEIAVAYRANPPKDLVDLMLETANEVGRLKRLFYLLNQGRMLADAKKEPLAAKHLLIAIERRNRRIQWPEEK